MATLETSLEANYDRRMDRLKKRLIEARATALPTNIESYILPNCNVPESMRQLRGLTLSDARGSVPMIYCFKWFVWNHLC